MKWLIGSSFVLAAMVWIWSGSLLLAGILLGAFLVLDVMIGMKA